MTVKELIEKLKECNQQAEVYINDSEFDYSPTSEVTKDSEYEVTIS